MNASILIVLLLLVFTSLVQCKTDQQVKSERKQFKEVYINQFKLTYFRRILIAGFNQSESVKTLIGFDKSGFTEAILSEYDYKFIDSLVYIDNQYMMADSSSSIGKAEGAEGKHVLGYILNKLESRWLDNLAHDRFKRSGLKRF